ncbi:unnamed protein product [Dicrocoelium dendriticum]|nr:unnamed protein product [Dicrocoelium dendriticum]
MATRLSPQKMQPLSLCILRPKPEPTESQLPIMSSNLEEVGASLDHPKKDPLDSEALPTVDRSFKTEQVGNLDSLDGCHNLAAGEPLVPNVSEQVLPTHHYEGGEQSFSDRSNLRAHVKCVHLKQRDHTCEYCGKSFSRRCRLRAHVEAVHLKQRKYTCKRCDDFLKNLI